MRKTKKRKFNKKSNKLKKELTVIIIEILILLITVIAIGAFIFLSKLNSHEKINNVTANYLTFTYKESENDHIQLKSSMPLSDSKAKENIKNCFEFKVDNMSNKESKYQIVLQQNYSSINGDYIKIYLMDSKNKPLEGFDNKVPVWSDFENTGKTAIIYTDKLDKKESKTFKLMVWISEDYVVTDKQQDFSFKVAIKDNNK